MAKNDQTARKTTKWLHILITELLCAAIILSGIIVIKYFFKGTYIPLKEWYETEILNDTDINQILETGGEKDEI